MRIALFFTAMFLAPEVVMSQAPVTLDAKSQAELLATRERAWRAWFGGDRATLEAMLPAEFVGIGWGGGAWASKAATLSASQEFARGGGKLSLLEFPHTDVQVYGDAAFVYSTYRAGITTGGEQVLQEGRSTEVFVRKGGKWLHPGWHLDSGK